ncbi:spermidine synthase [Alkalibacillus flavidus]|uniref:Spermidine synthase n=1 Tax=Alkalibacillus flavidus TaxID=546021 RepID=A0ABV2KZK4_9BACI
MNELTIIERTTTNHGELQLQQRGFEYEVISNGTFLMATYNGESERELVRSPLNLLTGDKRVLIGGLGVGFSLHEAISDESVSQVDIIEIEETIIHWNKDYLAPLTNHAIFDDRTRIIHADLTQWIYHTDNTYDAICLDIDNGPDWTVYDDNQSLYQPKALSTLHERLNQYGVIAFWSAHESDHFYTQLTHYFNHVQTVFIPQPKGADDVIYLAQK